MLVWLVTLEGTVDLVNGLLQGARSNSAGGYALGAAWFIPTLFVPAVLMLHALIFWQLLRPQRTVGAPYPIPSESMTPNSELAAQSRAAAGASGQQVHGRPQ